MLTANEISDALRHDRATGNRPAGHFDHDAALNIGPVAFRNVESTSQSLTNSENTVMLQFTTNPSTGERTYSLIAN